MSSDPQHCFLPLIQTQRYRSTQLRTGTKWRRRFIGPGSGYFRGPFSKIRVKAKKQKQLDENPFFVDKKVSRTPAASCQLLPTVSCVSEQALYLFNSVCCQAIIPSFLPDTFIPFPILFFYGPASNEQAFLRICLLVENSVQPLMPDHPKPYK
jgi:hypothetical protein